MFEMPKMEMVEFEVEEIMTGSTASMPDIEYGENEGPIDL